MRVRISNAGFNFDYDESVLNNCKWNVVSFALWILPESEEFNFSKSVSLFGTFCVFSLIERIPMCYGSIDKIIAFENILYSLSNISDW
jgi:hypothetical protein